MGSMAREGSLACVSVSWGLFRFVFLQFRVVGLGFALGVELVPLMVRKASLCYGQLWFPPRQSLCPCCSASPSHNQLQMQQGGSAGVIVNKQQGFYVIAVPQQRAG